MTDLTLTKDALVDAYKQGDRFFLRTLGDDCKHCGGWTNVEMVVSTSDPDCKDIIMSWIKKHDTRSVSVYRILPDGSSDNVGIFQANHRFLKLLKLDNNEMKTKDYQIIERTEGMWVIAHIVGETPDALDRGISDYRHRYKYHDAGQPEKLSSLTAEVKRFYKL